MLPNRLPISLARESQSSKTVLHKREREREKKVRSKPAFLLLITRSDHTNHDHIYIHTSAADLVFVLWFEYTYIYIYTYRNIRGTYVPPWFYSPGYWCRAVQLHSDTSQLFSPYCYTHISTAPKKKKKKAKCNL